MTENQSVDGENCCDCKCGQKSGRLMIHFFLFVIILLLAGIFYTLQGMMAMCPAMANHHYGMKSRAMCPVTEHK